MASASELGHRPSFRVGATEIRPATCEVVGPGGRETIEPRVMQVLVVLADARGETVTRDELTMRCWGGRVVGDDSINRVTQKIRRLAEGPAGGGFTLKTIHKVGYRLVEQEGACAVAPSRASSPTESAYREGAAGARGLSDIAGVGTRSWIAALASANEGRRSDMLLGRRSLIAAVLAIPLLALPGCATLGGFGFVDAIRRLLTLSSQRAFDRLLEPGGFYDDQLARIDLPAELGGGGSVAAAILRSGPFRERLQRQLNLAAAEGAERAAPIVYDAIRGMSIADALSVVRGGPEAATALLRREMGDALIDAMLPEVGAALRIASDPVVGEALRVATGIDLAGLARDVTERASDSIYRAIGREEAAIRADPGATGDPLLIGVFGAL